MNLLPFLSSASEVRFSENSTIDDSDLAYAMVEFMFANNKVSVETGAEWRNVLAIRSFTAISSDAPRGTFDDIIIVTWLSKGGQKNAQFFNANTDPSYQYSAEGHKKYKKKSEGQDADGNKKNDLGMLPLGAYTYKAYTESHTVLGQVFKPIVADDRGIRVWRDINHDGYFNEADEALVKDENKMYEGKTMYIHRGYRQGQVVNTWSAGCQTLKFEDFEKFRESIASGKKAGQTQFSYVLVDKTQIVF